MHQGSSLVEHSKSCSIILGPSLLYPVSLYSIEPAKRGDSVKPGVERSGTPGSLEYKGRAREVGDSHFIISEFQLLRYRTLRALGFHDRRHPGVPLRYTPGFMLPPAARVLES